MTIWAFGDSYMEKLPDVDNWVTMVGKKLNHEVQNFGISGSSQSYSFEKFNDIRKDIAPNDIVIFAMTGFGRRWFVRNNPRIAVDTMYSHTSTSSYNKALKLYNIHLQHPQLAYTYFLDFLYNLKLLVYERNAHVIMMPCFDDVDEFLKDKLDEFSNINFSKGYLRYVDENEYEPKLREKIKGIPIRDGKMNHIVWSNHNILIDKVIDNILNRTTIDLLDDSFVKEIISDEAIKDPEYVKKEHLFKPEWKWTY